MPANIAFYAPMKPPDHAIASGDREIGRLTAAALERAGFSVEIASRFISYQKHPDREGFRALRREGATEAARIVEAVRTGRRAAPDLWFTYHPYCKAPDWIGPEVARALSIPYVTAEACRTHQGSDADWLDGRMAVREAIRLAGVNFCLKPSDEAYLRSILPDMASVVPLMPFLDVAAVRGEARRPDPATFFPDRAPVILAVGMMRPGAKMRSYRLLADALCGLDGRSWNLAIIGDGPERANAEAMFGFADRRRVLFTGALSRGEVLGWMGASDLLAWPGIGEAIGMVYLEAAACGLPVAACDVANVATTVSDGTSGLLAREGSAGAYGEVLERLLADGDLRRRLGEGGLERARLHHDIDRAAATLKAAIEPLLYRAKRSAGYAR
jgi:glycosyltransferase involved in cell wall biosynthesis